MTNDCIEKRAALDALWSIFCATDSDECKHIVGGCFKAISELPTVTTEGGMDEV